MATTPWDDLFCTDEDLAIRAPADFPLIVTAPVLAVGRDGTVSQASPWALSSASNDFAAQGVAAGHCMWLEKLGEPADGTVPYSEQLLAVDAVAGGTATLRPLGGSAGSGVGPGLLGDLASVRFRVATARPQIVTATQDIRRALRLGDDDDLAAASDVRRACVLRVLADLYYDRARAVNETDRPLWTGKGNLMHRAFQDEMAALAKLYGAGPGGARRGTILGEMAHDPAAGPPPADPRSTGAVWAERWS